MPRNDAAEYPSALALEMLGPDVIAELDKAQPGEIQDYGGLRDRFAINPGALGYWLWRHFQINVLADDLPKILIDPIREAAIIAGKEYQIPHYCYLNTGLEFGDRRPSTWPGFPRPEGDASNAK